MHNLLSCLLFCTLAAAPPQETGAIKLQDTCLEDPLTLIGSLLANRAKVHSFHVTGEARLSHTRVAHPSTLLGYLEASHTHFEAPLTFNGQRATFQDSHLHSLHVEAMESFKGKQIIVLRNTTLEGSLSFASQNGEVHLYPGSKIGGKVVGGKVLHKQ